VGALAAFSARHPGTSASGLAQLAAGWLLLESEAPLEAVSGPLVHADVALTPLADLALLGRARALSAAERHAEAGRAYLAALRQRPDAPDACSTLLAAAEALDEAQLAGEAADTWRESLDRCPGRAPRALLRLAEIEDAGGRQPEAAALYDRLDREHPASPEARASEQRLADLASSLPAVPAEEAAQRSLRKARALLRAGSHAAAADLLRPLLQVPSLAASRDEILLGLGRAEEGRGRHGPAGDALRAIPATSPLAAQAAYRLAGVASRTGPAVPGYEQVADRFSGTEWAQEALFDLGNHFQKDAQDERALPYYRRLYDEYPAGPFLERVTWRVGWGDYRAGRLAEAAATFESTSQKRPGSASAGVFLYWAGRARLALGQRDRASELFRQAVQSFKHTYHGIEAAAQLEALGETLPESGAPVPAPELRFPEPAATRIRLLLLIERYEEAARELRALPGSAGVEATLAAIERRRGRFAESIRATTRAFPEFETARGDWLPGEVWRQLFPIGAARTLVASARAEGVDPALVAALVRQESHFDAEAVSSAGARGLMQLMPGTGRGLARELGIRFQPPVLFDAELNLRMGTRYLRQMLDRFGGRVERALAAYNAGPHRVASWEASYPGLSREEFVESIPFTQTRLYVRKVLANHHHYLRLYDYGAGSRAAGAP
jgi:soluble lytic murein transglycosylase